MILLFILIKTISFELGSYYTMPHESSDPAGVKQGKQLVSRVISGKPVLSMVMNPAKKGN